jgi:L-aminopeptidase/D-esterase-like protein
MRKLRARELGIPFEGETGTLNALTDVPGVWVGHATIIEGEAVRTGVSAIRPRGEGKEPVFAAWYSLNGCGEMTGTTWVEESGLLHGPVMLTNTFSVGAVHQATIDWVLRVQEIPFGLPVVAETYDGKLNDIRGGHVKAEHAWEALENARAGPVAEGNVGGGTGMICYEFKGGIGTASRVVRTGKGDGARAYTLGALVQANHGSREHLTIAGVPVGRELQDGLPGIPPEGVLQKNSSIIVVIATDLPLLPHQLKRLARRVPLGLARTGAISEYSSGDIFLAFSTAGPCEVGEDGIRHVEAYDDWQMNPFFEACAQAVEEAVVNALAAAETMTGKDGVRVEALPVGRVLEIMRKYGRQG